MTAPNMNRTIKKVSIEIRDTLKYQEERVGKVKKALFTYIQDNNVEIISDDQIFFEGKHQNIDAFAERIKWLLENKNKGFPILSVEEYVGLLREINADQHRAQELLSTNHNSKYLSEPEILSLINNPKLTYSKSLLQAEEFLQHILFKVSDVNGAIKVVANRTYEVTDSQGVTQKIEKEILLPGFKNLKDYEDTLKHIPVRASIKEKQETYWDVFSRSKAVVQASMVYDPHKELYWCDEFKHYYLNTYKEPAWMEEPDHFYLVHRHKTSPVTFNKLSPLLRSFLIHLFPNDNVRKEVLKWCAFSTIEKLQTYLTLIGKQGIGKTLFVTDLLGYYHGSENVNIPKTIEIKYNAKCAESTLIYFDEMMMVNLEQYNEMKSYINPKISYEEKFKPIYMAQNFANIVWSCNTKDTMSGMSRDDRRFKIVPITDSKLMGAPILDYSNQKMGEFCSDTIKEFVFSKDIKQEFVLLMLAIRDHVRENQEIKNDINSIVDNDARDNIFSESRSIEFIEIIDVLKNVYNDFNPITGKFGSKPTNLEERESLGNIYEDYIPLSKIVPARDEYYTFRIPFAIVRKVILTKAGKYKPMSFRNFNRHLDNMPSKIIKGYARGGQMRDIEIRLLGENSESHDYFINKYLPLLTERHIQKETIKNEENPFE